MPTEPSVSPSGAIDALPPGLPPPCLRGMKVVIRRPIVSVIALLHVTLLNCSCVSSTPSSLVDRIPPEAATVSAIVETAVRIHLYMVANRVPPPDLSVLPVRKGYSNQTTDGWGRDLQYSVDAAGVITLMSYGPGGKDGAPAARTTRRYRTRNADGSSNIDRNDWIVTAEVPPGADPANTNR
jgi:hypothetical protein